MEIGKRRDDPGRTDRHARYKTAAAWELTQCLQCGATSPHPEWYTHKRVTRIISKRPDANDSSILADCTLSIGRPDPLLRCCNNGQHGFDRFLPGYQPWRT